MLDAEMIVLRSVGFSTKAACLAGIRDFQKGAANDGNFIRVLSEDRRHFFVLTIASNHVIAASETYPTAEMMERDIIVVQTEGPTARVAESCKG